MTKHVDILNADVAGDEQRAARLLNVSHRGLASTFKQSLLTRKDVTRAVRRAVSRPEKADPYLKEIAWNVFMKRRSIAKLVKESHQFTKRFNMHVKRVSESPVDAYNIRNLRFVAQRCESCQRPRARFVLFMDVVIATACDIVAIGKGQV